MILPNPDSSNASAGPANSEAQQADPWRLRFDRTTAFFTAVTALAVFLGTIATQPMWKGIRDKLFDKEPIVEIEGPRPSAIEHQVRIAGRAENIPEDKTIWFATIAIDEGNRYHPNNTSCIPGSDDHFECPPYFVGPAKHPGGTTRYQIVAVLADAEAREEFANYQLEVSRTGRYVGMEKLPESAKRLDSVEVSRNS